MNKDEARSAVIGAISMALKDTILQQGFEIICKELEELEAENNDLCDSLETQGLKVSELESQIEKMKCCGNCKHCKYDENEESYEFCEKHQQVMNIAIQPCCEWEDYKND